MWHQKKISSFWQHFSILKIADNNTINAVICSHTIILIYQTNNKYTHRYSQRVPIYKQIQSHYFLSIVLYLYRCYSLETLNQIRLKSLQRWREPYFSGLNLVIFSRNLVLGFYTSSSAVPVCYFLPKIRIGKIRQNKHS